MKRLHAALMTSAMIAIASLSFSAFGQAQGGDDVLGGGDYELGLMLGSLLPHQISGVSEIMGLGGVRGGMRFAPSGWVEAAVNMGNGNGQTWRDAAVDLRMDIPVENLVGIAFIGLDLLQYSGPGTSSTLGFGGHVGGGIQANVGGPIWIRTDMKFQFNPGTSLMIGLSFIYRF